MFFEKTIQALQHQAAYIHRAVELLGDIPNVRIPANTPPELLAREKSLANSIRTLKQEMAVGLFVECTKTLNLAQSLLVEEASGLPAVTDPAGIEVHIDADLPPS